MPFANALGAFPILIFFPLWKGGCSLTAVLHFRRFCSAAAAAVAVVRSGYGVRFAGRAGRDIRQVFLLFSRTVSRHLFPGWS